MIKAIIFDNNGVLASSDNDFVVPRLAKYFGMEHEAFKRHFNELIIAADYGKETTDEFFEKLCEKLGKECNHDELWSIFGTCHDPKQGMQDLLRDLKCKYQLALLTNFIDAFDYFNVNVWHYKGIFDEDKMFVSSKLGMLKPNADIYLYVLDKLGVKPDEAIFIDDKQVNIDAAEKLGIKGILFKNIEQLKSDLKNLTVGNE